MERQLFCMVADSCPCGKLSDHAVQSGLSAGFPSQLDSALFHQVGILPPQSPVPMFRIIIHSDLHITPPFLPDCPPLWLDEKYPEVLLTGRDGRRQKPAVRGHRCSAFLIHSNLTTRSPPKPTSARRQIRTTQSSSPASKVPSGERIFVCAYGRTGGL